MSDVAAGPIVFAYDGSELAELAIAQAGRQLVAGQDAVVVCVWQPADVGFTPVGGEKTFDAADAEEVRKAAADVARHGAALAEQAGFRAVGVELTAAPTWKGVVKVAKERDASLIVIGSHRRRGVSRHLLGSVAQAVVSHSASSVLVVHQRDEHAASD